MEFFELNVLGLTRELPILPTPSGLMIAGFNPVGDIPLLIEAGKDLARQIREGGNKCDVILTTELKGLPIAQEVARELGVDYVCLRKEKKCVFLPKAVIPFLNLIPIISSLICSACVLIKFVYNTILPFCLKSLTILDQLLLKSLE